MNATFLKHRILQYYFHSQADRFVKTSMILYQVDSKNAFLKKISVISFFHHKTYFNTSHHSSNISKFENVPENYEGRFSGVINNFLSLVLLKNNEKWQCIGFFLKAGRFIKQYQILETHSEKNEIQALG